MSGPCTVHHVEEGERDAPPLVLSNSLGTALEVWAAQAPALARRFRLVRYDHRGHGRSPVPPGPYEIADLAGDVAALLDRLGVARASFCGLSIGGMVGLWLAAHAPERIERLVLVCSSPHMPPASAWAERAAAVRAAGSVEVVADAVVGRWFTPEYAEAHPDVHERLRAMLVTTPADGYAECCGAIERMDLRADLAAVRAPTLVIAGERDPAAPPAEHGRVIADGIRGARFELVSAAHLANVERPDAVTALITDHLEQEAV
jgi:3-oxoadipate enol-lactonase